MKNIYKALQDRILVLDGAMGTMIQKYTLTEEDFRGERFKDHHKPLMGNNDLLSLSRPDIIKQIHREYFQAGADIVETNTFSSTSIAQADYDLQAAAYDLNFQSAKIAKEVASEFEDKYVAGSIGPTNTSASISPDVNNPAFRSVSFEELKDSYREQINGLIDGGADLILIETVFDTLNAKAALMATQEAFDEKNIELPVMVSGTITDASGRTLSGQTAEAFLISISHFPLLSVGFNCALGAEQLRPYIETISNKSEFMVSAHPNAGLPNEFGEYDQSPEEMAEIINGFCQSGFINIIGGCCGTSPDHIKAIAEVAKNNTPRKVELSQSIQ